MKVADNPTTALVAGLLLLVVCLGGLVIWSVTAKLDEGTPVQGTVAADSKRKGIQHPTGGVIEEIRVRDGDRVKKDQVLVRLSSTQNKAAVAVDRHQAEATSAQLAQLSVQVRQIASQISVLEPELEKLRPLVEAGYYPKNQYLDKQLQYLDKKNQRLDLERQAAEVKRQHDDALSKIKAAEEDAARTDIRSPVDGVVMGSTITIGGIVPPGAKIMEIEPADEKLVLEIQIPVNLIDKIQAGLECDVRLTALNQRTTPVLQGIVQWISPDRVQDPQHPEVAYYTGRVGLKPGFEKELGGAILLAGMPTQVIIKTGQRTFWDYLIKPFQDRAALALKER